MCKVYALHEVKRSRSRTKIHEPFAGNLLTIGKPVMVSLFVALAVLTDKSTLHLPTHQATEVAVQLLACGIAKLCALCGTPEDPVGIVERFYGLAGLEYSCGNRAEVDDRRMPFRRRQKAFGHSASGSLPPTRLASISTRSTSCSSPFPAWAARPMHAWIGRASKTQARAPAGLDACETKDKSIALLHPHGSQKDSMFFG